MSNLSSVIAQNSRRLWSSKYIESDNKLSSLSLFYRELFCLESTVLQFSVFFRCLTSLFW